MSVSRLDLTSAKDIKTYLCDGPFACSDLEKLAGGYTNFLFRLHLVEPFEGHSTLVFKYGVAFELAKAGFDLDLTRQDFEIQAMRWVSTWIAPSSLVTVPNIYLFDEKAHCFIMDDCGYDSVTLKSFVIDGTCTPALSKQIGSALGAFLAQMHTQGVIDQEIRKAFETNIQAKRISGWVSHGRVEETLNSATNTKLPALQDPPLEVPADVIAALGVYAKEVEAAVLASTETFVMGDFWPGNILVTLDDSGKQVKSLGIVDWELAKLGIPGHDLGQFAAEAHLMARFYPQEAETCHALVDALSKAYAEGTGRDSVASDPVLLRDMMSHKGAHLVVFTPRVPWGSKEVVREVVTEGWKQLKQFC